MLVKIKPAKVLKDTNGKGVTHYLENVVEYYAPDPAEMLSILSEEGALDLDDSKEAQEWSEETGIPPYVNDQVAWLAKASAGLARGKATSNFKVNGNSPDSLELEVTGNIPQTFEDLLTSEAGGAFLLQKAAFVKVFSSWIESHTSNPKQFTSALSRPSMDATAPEAWPVIERAVEAFCKTLEDESEYAVYLRTLRRQLKGEPEAEDWSSADILSL